jgi:two-component system, cell cycle sensor histidine kinase and response regulator CckA
MAASTPALVERLGWARGAHGVREAAERDGMARAGLYLLAVGGVLALASLALPTDEARNGTAIIVTATIALALSLVPLVGFDGLPLVAFELLASAGTLLVSSALWFGGSGGYELFYFWVALYAAYFLPPRKVVGQVAFMVSCYGLVGLAGPGQGVSPAHWLVAAGTLSVAAGLVMLLKANLLASIERLEALIEASPLASIELDAEGRVRGWNGAAEALLGWRFDEVVGLPLPVESAEEDGLLLRLIQSSQSGLDLELSCKRRSGEIFDASLHTAPVGNGDGIAGGHIVLLADTTAHKEVDRRLAHASKMESIGRLAGGIAHDFNNLLLVIRSHASLLRERLGEIVAAELDEVERAAEDAGHLVRQLLAFGSNRAVEPTIVDADVVLARVESMLRPLMHEDIEFVRMPSAVPPTALADPTQVELVIVNLALNARDALPDGGTITVATEVVEREGGHWVALRVSDTGVGMDEDTQAHVFEPFFTTKDETHGTGLGLFIVHELVEHAGGAIEVSSAPGRGTTFVVYLPYVEHIVDETLVPFVAEPERGGEAGAGMETVLVAEDEDDVRESIRAALEHYGYTVLSAADPATALVLARDRADEIDLVVADLVLPDMNGRELGRRLAAIAPDLPVVYMSGQSEGSQLAEREALFLAKPFSPPALASTIRAALRSAKVRTVRSSP